GGCGLETPKGFRTGQPTRVPPRGIGVTFHGKFVITSNKNTSDGAVFTTADLSLVKRIHIGESPEFIKINPAGDRLFATFEPSSKGGPPPATAGGAKGDSEDENGPPARTQT